jgi:ABC-type transporter Mla subunit MlaD
VKSPAKVHTANRPGKTSEETTMTDRHAIQREIEDKLARAEHALHGLKAKLGEAGHEASRDLADAADAAERTLEKGQAKLAQLASATDEEFETLWDETKDAWHALASDAERGWTQISDRVKSYFA